MRGSNTEELTSVYEDVLHGTADIGLVAFPTPHKELSVIPLPTMNSS